MKTVLDAISLDVNDGLDVNYLDLKGTPHE